jgi:hypothetical protein
MADYYTYVSFTITLKPHQQDWAVAELTRDPTDDEDCYPGVICEKNGAPANFDFVTTEHGTFEAPPRPGEYLWICHDESAHLDSLSMRLQNIMRHFAIDGKWGFEWTQDSSKPRLDAYGGGACTISQTEIEWMNTGNWLLEHGVEAD